MSNRIRPEADLHSAGGHCFFSQHFDSISRAKIAHNRKHKFDIDIVPIEGEYTSQGYEITSENPPLKHGSRIAFEFKDSNNVFALDS